ncbi:MAG: hypothetical protein PF569_08070 [Candidatus Woesearchaeota archaeon]|jgi:hypothetical protein|nr:hypothetical protein [Candidatus Woesearchaeota archaeon]
MMKKLFILLMILFLANSVMAGTNEEIYITPNDYDGSLSVKFVTTMYVDEFGYYLEPFTFEEYFPKASIENLKISDFGKNKLRKTELQNDEDLIIYQIKTPEIQYEEPYQILYEFKIPYGISSYLGNKDINFFLWNEGLEEIRRKVYFCKPSNAKDYIEYDSTPIEMKDSYESEYESYKSTPISPYTIDPITYNYNPNSYVEEAYPDFCKSGKKERIYYNNEYGYDESVGFYNIKYNDGTGTLETFTEGQLEIKLPDSFSHKASNLLKAEKVITTLKDEYKFDLSSQIIIKVVDDNDKVFDTYKEAADILCYEGGQCFFKNSGYITEDLSYDLANTILTLIVASSIETYGELETNWFSDAYQFKLMLDLMDKHNFDSIQIKKDFEENIFNDSDVENTKILMELEKSCPQVIKKVNEYITKKGGVSFADELAFNNFLLYTFTNVCEETDAKAIYDKYELVYDKEVPTIKNSYIELKNKIEPLSNELKLNAIEDIKAEFSGIEALFLKGEFTTASYKIEYLTNEYENSILSLKTSIDEYIETKNKLESDTSFNLYSSSIDESLELSMKALNYGDSNGAIIQLENAKMAHKEAKKNSWITVIIILIICGLVVGYFYLKSKKSKKEKQHNKSKKNYHSKKLKE